MDVLDQMTSTDDDAADKLGCTDLCAHRHTNQPGCNRWVPEHKRVKDDGPIVSER